MMADPADATTGSTIHGRPPPREVLLDDGGDESGGDDHDHRVQGPDHARRAPEDAAPARTTPLRTLPVRIESTNSPRPQRTERNASESGPTTEWSLEDEGWVPKPARLHSGKTRSCAVCFAPLQYTTMASWDEYLASEEYLARLQDNLMSDAFVASLICGDNTGGDLPMEHRMHKNRRLKCRQSVHDFANMTSAGIIDHSYKEKTSVRILEEMLLTALPTPVFANVLERRLAVLSHSTAIARKLMWENRSRKAPLEVAPEAENVEMHHLAIQTLSALLKSFDYGSPQAQIAFDEMGRLLKSLPALSLFSFWSPVRKPPEQAMHLDRSMVEATSCATSPRLLPAEFAIDGADSSFWQSQSRPGTTYYSIRAPGLEHVSSISIRWHLKAFPSTVGVEYRLKGSTSFATLNEQHATVTNGPVRFQTCFPSQCEEIRLSMRGIPAVNRSSIYAIEQLKLNIPISTSLFQDPKSTVADISKWLMCAVGHAKEDIVIEAIGALCSWTLATASLSSVLTFIKMLDKVKLLYPDNGRPGIASFTADKAVLLEEGIRSYVVDQREKSVLGATKKTGRDSRKVRAFFEPTCCSAGVTVEDGGLAVRTRETSYQYAAVNVGISSGRASWKFRLDNDTVDDEMTCFGAAILPVTVSGYDSSPNLWMLRGYNGNLYARGHKLSRSIGKVHPGDVVQVDVDMSEGTLAYKVNDTDHGVVFTDLTGHEVFPAVSFYGSGKVITLLGVERWDDNESGTTGIEPTYLSNVKEYYSYVGYGTLGKGSQLGYASNTERSVGNQPNGTIQIRGERKQRCLSTHPPARGDAYIIYDLEEAYKSFSGSVAINDDIQDDAFLQRAMSLVFSIVGDGDVLWQSSKFSDSRFVESFDVSICGVRMLELRVSCSGSNHWAHAVWVDPTLIPLEEWICQRCKVSNKGFLRTCTVCRLCPEKRCHVRNDPLQLCESQAMEASQPSVAKLGHSKFDELSNSILREVVALCGLTTPMTSGDHTKTGAIECAEKFEQPFCRQPCEIVFAQLSAMLADRPLKGPNEVDRTINLLKILSWNLSSIGTYEVTSDELGINKTTLRSLRTRLEQLSGILVPPQSITSPASVTAAQTLVAGLHVLYNTSEKMNILLSLLKMQGFGTFSADTPHFLMLSSMLQILSAPGRDGIGCLLRTPIGDLGTEYCDVSIVEELVCLLLASAKLASPRDICCMHPDSSNVTQLISDGALKVLQSYQTMILSEGLENTKCPTDSNPACDEDVSRQLIRTYTQDSVVRFSVLLLQSCTVLLKDSLAAHAEEFLQSSTDVKHTINATDAPIMSRLLPWLLSSLCLLRRQAWLAVPVLPAVSSFLETMDRYLSELRSIQKAEHRLRQFEGFVKARSLETRELDRMLATDKALAIHHQASKPMYNVFKQLYTGDKDHFEGQIGFQFEATSTFTVIALGRSVNPTKNSGQLVRQHTVRLWEESSQNLLGQVTVSATSRKDGLGYAIEALGTPVRLMQGKLYRLTTQEYANGGDPWYKKENLPDEEYDGSYIRILRDCYASGSTGFPNSQNLSGAAYGVPTFLVEGDDALDKLSRFIAPFGATSLKFSMKRKPRSISISHSATSARIVGSGMDLWRSCFLQSSVFDGVHALDFVVKSARIGGTASGHICIGAHLVTENSESTPQAFFKTFLGAQLHSFGWMPSIGMLWVDGNAIPYGAAKPVLIGDILTMVIDCDSQQVSFMMNGVSNGPAFGWLCQNDRVGTDSIFPKALTPGASLYSAHDVVEVRPAGIGGSTLCVHWLLDAHNTAASLAGRLASTLIAGHPVDSVEEELLPWLQSPLLSGGSSSISFGRDEFPEWDVLMMQQGRDNKRARPTKQVDRLRTEERKSRLVKRPSYLDELGQEESALLEELMVDASDTGPAAVLIIWLEATAPDRSILSRLGKFHSCERQTLAALIKHSPVHVLHEVQAIVASTRLSTDHATIDLTPSDDLLLVWKQVVKLRHWLIKSRQEYKAKSNDDSENYSRSPSANDVPTGNAQKGVSELEMKISIAKNFDELVLQICERAKFLCMLNPPSEERERLGKESQLALSNLADKWSAHKTPPSLEPMLERWRSLRESDSTKWSGIVDILRAQHRWRERRASIHGASPQPEPPATGLVPGQGESGGSRYQSSFSAMLRACDLYIRNGIGAPPDILRGLMERRQKRAESRVLGLDAMKSIVSAVSFNSARHNAILFLRPALRGIADAEKESKDVNESQVVAETFRATERHHYLKGLEGCHRRTVQKVQTSFWGLYSVLSNLLVSCSDSVIPDSQLKQAIICAWCLDFEPRDHEYLLKAGILSSLQSEFSLEAVIEKARDEFEDLRHIRQAADTGSSIDHDALNWHPLSEEFVQRSALSGGYVTKRDILTLMYRAPSWMSSRKWRVGNATTEFNMNPIKDPASAVVLRYGELMSGIRHKLAWCEEHTLGRKVLQFGVHSSTQPGGSSQSKPDPLSYAEVPALGECSDLTVETWVCPYELTGYRAIRMDNGFLPGSVYLEFVDRHLQFSINGNRPREQLFRNYQFETHEWSHIAITYSASRQKAHLYVNGSLVDCKMYSISQKSVMLRQSRIGCWVSDIDIEGSPVSNITPQRAFKGCIAEMRLWSICRTIAQIRRDFQRAIPYDVVHDDRAALLGLWHLDEGEGLCGNDRIQTYQTVSDTLVCLEAKNASIVSCHWVHANVPVWSNDCINQMEYSRWNRLLLNIRRFQRASRRFLELRSRRWLQTARQICQTQEAQHLVQEWGVFEDPQDKSIDHVVEPNKEHENPSCHLSVLSISTDDIVLHRKHVRRCAWTVFRFLAHVAICGTFERRESEASSASAAAKSRRKQRFHAVSESSESIPSPSSKSGTRSSEAARAAGLNIEEEDTFSKTAEAASDAAKTAASNRHLEEPVLQTLWFSSELHRKVYEILEKELVIATSMIQTAEGLTRAQRTIRSTSTPVHERGTFVRSQQSVVLERNAKPHNQVFSKKVGSLVAQDILLEPLEVELFLNKLLAFVLVQCKSPASLLHLVRPRILREILLLLRFASPRSQRIVKLILRSICGNGAVSPDRVAEILGSESVLIELLLDQVAESVCSTAAPMPTHAIGVSIGSATEDKGTSNPISQSLSTPVGFRSGQVYLAAASESVALMRLLLKNNAWGRVVATLLSSTIRNVTPLLSQRRFQGRGDALESPNIRTRMSIIRAVGALCVLSSHTDCIRVGGRVEVTAKEVESQGTLDYGFNFSGTTASPTLATLIEINSRSATARVVFDSSSDESDPSHNVQEVNLASVSPVEELTLPGELMLLTSDMMPVILKLASLDASEVLDNFDELWRMQIRSRALLAFESVLRHSAKMARNLDVESMTRNLLESALKPVGLSTFVSLPFLQERGRMILCRLIEASTPMGEAMFRGLSDPKPPVLDEVTNTGSSMIERSDDPVHEETEEYRVRRGFAATLAAMGFEFDLCMAALEHSRNDPNLAVEWLMGVGAIEYQERQESRRLAAATLESRKPTRVNGENEDNLSLEAKASELQSISGMPYRLAYCALELTNADPNRAMEWLMEHGSRYENAPEVIASLNDGFHAETTNLLSDCAALEDVDQVDPLVASSSNETSIHMTIGINDRNQVENIMAVTLAPILAPLPATSKAKKAKEAQDATAFAALDPDYLTPFVLLTISAEVGPVQRLSTTGRTGVFRRYSPQDGVLVTFLNTESGAYEDEWHAPTDVRRITRIYDEPLDGVASIHRVALRTEHALSTHYARRGATVLMRTWEAVASQSPENAPSTHDLMLSIGGPRQFVKLLKLVVASEMVFARQTGLMTDFAKPQHQMSAVVSLDDPGSISSDLQLIALRILKEETTRFCLLQQSNVANARIDSHQLTDEGTKEGAQINILAPSPTLQQEERGMVYLDMIDRPDDCGGLLANVLVNECVSHFVKSTQVAGNEDSMIGGAETIEFQSLHPYFGRCDYARAVALDKNHKCVRVKFDKRCKLGSKSKLTFFSDPEFQNVISVVDGASTSTGKFLPDVVIQSHCFWFRFTASEDDPVKNNGYGYKFQVKPMQNVSWSNETEVLQNPSLEWACWVLEFLLSQATELVSQGAVHNQKIYGALVRYVRSPGAPFKDRVVRLLIQLLHHPELFSSIDVPNLEPLEAVGRLALERAKAEKSSGKTFLSAQLLQLIELSIVTKRAVVLMKHQDLRSNTMAFKALQLPIRTEELDASSQLDDLVAISGFLLGDVDYLPGHILTSIWLDVFGSTAIIESSHPYTSNESNSGRIMFPGAQSLVISFGSRCCTGEGSTLELFCGCTQAHDSSDGCDQNCEHRIKHVWGGDESWPTGMMDLPGDQLLFNFRGADNVNALFGVQVCVSAVGFSVEQQLSRATMSDLESVLDSLCTQRDGWNSSMDSQLVEWVNNYVENSNSVGVSAGNIISTDLRPVDIRIHHTLDGLRCSHLLDRSLLDVHLRFSLLKQFNQRLKETLVMLDLRSPKSSWTIANKLRSLGHCIFFDLKNAFVEAAIDATNVPGDVNSSSNTARITLDRLQALESRDDREVEPSISECFFAQAFRQLNHVDTSVFRRKIDNKGRLFSVKFRGEEGVDWGGVYREGVNSMVDDLFSAHFNLFVLCPNGQHDTGTNRGMYLPNPKCTSPVAIQMFEFVGKLLGISLRTHGDFPFAFPSLVWKQMIGEPLDRSDLEGTDSMFVQMLDGIQNCERDGILTDDEFDVAFEGLDLRFTAFDCNGQEVELIDGGKLKRVNFTNRLEFCKLAQEYRLFEGSKQVAAMSRGFATIFPLRVLTILTWQEMEILTCGSPKIDIKLWKHHTRYDGYNENDDTVLLFWEAMGSFTDEQRSDFVRFAWGRSRLPRGKWPQPFKLTKKGGRDSTLSLPVAHTCFFSVELPPYTTLDKMRSMLLATINFGLGGILMA